MKVLRNPINNQVMKYGERNQKVIINFFKWDIRKVNKYYEMLRTDLKNAFNRYFKGLGLENITISDYNNGDIRIIDNNCTYDLKKLFDLYGINYWIVSESKNMKVYRLNLFYWK